MPTYQVQILNARTRFTDDILDESSQAMLDALQRLNADIAEMLRSSEGRNGAVNRRLWQAKKVNVENAIARYAAVLGNQVNSTPRQVVTMIRDATRDATAQLIADSGQSIGLDFSDIPEQVMRFLTERANSGVAEFSERVWTSNNSSNLLGMVNRQIGTKSIPEIASTIRGLILGSDALTLDELKDLRTVRGASRRKLGHSIKYKSERLVQTETAFANWEASRLSAERSPVVSGVKWNLSNRHPVWDVCDVFAEQNLYGLGKGIYPSERLATRPHPYCRCFLTDELRLPEDWNTPKETPAIQKDVDKQKIRGQGGKGHIDRQSNLFRKMVKEVEMEVV